MVGFFFETKLSSLFNAVCFDITHTCVGNQNCQHRPGNNMHSLIGPNRTLATSLRPIIIRIRCCCCVGIQNKNRPFTTTPVMGVGSKSWRGRFVRSDTTRNCKLLVTIRTHKVNCRTLPITWDITRWATRHPKSRPPITMTKLIAVVVVVVVNRL